MTKHTDIIKALEEIEACGERLRVAKQNFQRANSAECSAMNDLNSARKVYDRLMGEYMKGIDPQWGAKNPAIPIAS